MQRTALLLGTLLSLTIACGDPKGAAGAIGAPVQNMDPSKMNKSAKDQKTESKIEPADQKAWKFNPETPDVRAQKVTPVAPVDHKIP